MLGYINRESVIIHTCSSNVFASLRYCANLSSRSKNRSLIMSCLRVIGQFPTSCNFVPSSEMLARSSLLIAVSSRLRARSARSDATASSLRGRGVGKVGGWGGREWGEERGVRGGRVKGRGGLRARSARSDATASSLRGSGRGIGGGRGRGIRRRW